MQYKGASKMYYTVLNHRQIIQIAMLIKLEGSFTNKINNIGSITEPWIMPLVTGIGDEEQLSTTTCCTRSDKNTHIQSKHLSTMPYDLSLCNNLLCTMLSKARRKSIYTTSTEYLLFKAILQSLVQYNVNRVFVI